MRKRIGLFIFGFMLVFFILIFIVLGFDYKYNKDIYVNTGIDNIKYVNEYDNYYIIVNDKYLFLFNSDYDEITRIDLYLIHENTKNYDIIYKDKSLMYLNDYKKDDGVVFEYYDIYKYDLIEKIIVGGRYE